MTCLTYFPAVVCGSFTFRVKYEHYRKALEYVIVLFSDFGIMLLCFQVYAAGTVLNSPMSMLVAIFSLIYKRAGTY